MLTGVLCAGSLLTRPLRNILAIAREVLLRKSSIKNKNTPFWFTNEDFVKD